MSSLMYKTIGSKNLPAPVAIEPFCLYDLPKPLNKKNISNPTKIIINKFLVIEKSIGFCIILVRNFSSLITGVYLHHVGRLIFWCRCGGASP